MAATLVEGIVEGLYRSDRFVEVHGGLTACKHDGRQRIKDMLKEPVRSKPRPFAGRTTFRML